MLVVDCWKGERVLPVAEVRLPSSKSTRNPGQDYVLSYESYSYSPLSELTKTTSLPKLKPLANSAVDVDAPSGAPRWMKMSNDTQERGKAEHQRLDTLYRL